MRNVLTFLALAAIACQSSARIDIVSPIEKGLLDFLVKCDSIKNYRHHKNIDSKNLHFHWHNTRTNKETTVDLEQAPDVFRKEYYYEKNDPVYVHVPGFDANPEASDIIFVKDGITKLKNINYILFDSSFYLKYDNETQSDAYLKAISNTYGVGYVLGNVLATFIKSGLQLNKLHVFGHSLGAQLVGYAARQVYLVNRQKLKRISGIDPAGKCFDELEIEDQISSDDADYVDIYHVNMGVMGTTHSLGTANFFINSGGPQQPSCPGIPYVSQRCSHLNTSINFWVASTQHLANFKARQCDSYERWQNGKCDKLPTALAGFFSVPCKGNYYLKFEFNYNSQVPNIIKTRLVEYWNKLSRIFQ